MCPWILSLVIVGAVEAEPGWMTIQHSLPNQPTVIETIHVPTDQYLECLTN
jgi:rRNA maturation protein Rpf1